MYALFFHWCLALNPQMCMDTRVSDWHFSNVSECRLKGDEVFEWMKSLNLYDDSKTTFSCRKATDT